MVLNPSREVSLDIIIRLNRLVCARHRSLAGATDAVGGILIGKESQTESVTDLLISRLRGFLDLCFAILGMH